MRLELGRACEPKLPTLGHRVQAGCKHLEGLALVVAAARIALRRARLLKVNARAARRRLPKNVLALDEVGPSLVDHFEVRPAVLVEAFHVRDAWNALEQLSKVMLGNAAANRGAEAKAAPDDIEDLVRGEPELLLERMPRWLLKLERVHPLDEK